MQIVGKGRNGKWSGLKWREKRKFQRKKRGEEKQRGCKDPSFSIWDWKSTMVLIGKKMGFLGRERRNKGGVGGLWGQRIDMLTIGLLKKPFFFLVRGF